MISDFASSRVIQQGFEFLFRQKKNEIKSCIIQSKMSTLSQMHQSEFRKI